MRVAFVYDRVNKWGGAERLLLELHKLFPKAPLFTSVCSPKTAPWAKQFDVRTSFLQSFPFAKTSHELYPLLMPIAFESLTFNEYDLVISVTSEAAKGIITKPKTLHICYCLTPTRYLWSGYNDYFRNPLLRVLSKPAVSYLRLWDRVAATRPDAYFAISKEVQRRIKQYYGRESTIIYPPLALDARARGPAKGFPPRSSLNSADYFLIVSRLVPSKRVDIAVRAFNRLGLPLKIIGTGSDAQHLRFLAKRNVEFLGNLTEGALVRYYRGCRALIVPGIEDFGLTAVEAQSFGKPVIGFRGGGALETVVEGRTGLFFSPQTEETLIQAVETFNRMEFDKKECIEQAERFNRKRFKEQFVLLVQGLLSRKQ